MATLSSTTLVHPASLGDTLDAVNAALFEHRPIANADREEAAGWIADRQGLPGAYAGMFAPTEQDYAFGALTFTGEPVRSGAATGHILSEEACRALLLLCVDTPEVREALKRARRGIFHRIEESEVEGRWSGVYCCGLCTVSLWRHLLASGTAEDARRLDSGLAELRRHRDGEGRWRRFPFYYTMLALAEIDLPAVRDEIAYAERVIDRSLRRLIRLDPDREDAYDRRRRLVLQKALENQSI